MPWPHSKSPSIHIIWVNAPGAELASHLRERNGVASEVGKRGCLHTYIDRNVDMWVQGSRTSIRVCFAQQQTAKQRHDDQPRTDADIDTSYTHTVTVYTLYIRNDLFFFKGEPLGAAQSALTEWLIGSGFLSFIINQHNQTINKEVLWGKLKNEKTGPHSPPVLELKTNYYVVAGWDFCLSLLTLRRRLFNSY